MFFKDDSIYWCDCGDISKNDFEEYEGTLIEEKILTTRPTSLKIEGGDTDTKVYECVPSNEITMTVQGLRSVNDHIIVSPAVESIDNYNYFNIDFF